jgi:hypothetical protein
MFRAAYCSALQCPGASLLHCSCPVRGLCGHVLAWRAYTRAHVVRARSVYGAARHAGLMERVEISMVGDASDTDSIRKVSRRRAQGLMLAHGSRSSPPFPPSSTQHASRSRPRSPLPRATSTTPRGCRRTARTRRSRTRRTCTCTPPRACCRLGSESSQPARQELLSCVLRRATPRALPTLPLRAEPL